MTILARTVKEELLQGAIVTALNDGYARRNMVIPLLERSIRETETVFDDLETRITVVNEQLASQQEELIAIAGDEEAED